MLLDLRTALEIDDDVMSSYIQGNQILTPPARAPASDPAPAHHRVRRHTPQRGRRSSPDCSPVRRAWVKAEFGDHGICTVLSGVVTPSVKQLTWTTDEWIGQYFTDATGESYLVISNTATFLVLSEGPTTPVAGAFVLGPNAAAYRFFAQMLSPVTPFDPIHYSQGEQSYQESPTKMEYVWHGLTPATTLRVEVQALGDWFQESASAKTAPVDIVVGSVKQIPEVCGDAVTNVIITAEADGLHVTWDLQPAYAAYVQGIEIVYTDDGVTPDFTSISQRKMYTDRMHIILPVVPSYPDHLKIVKAKMRCVDKAGRHCTTPLSLTATQSILYDDSVKNVVEDVADARGSQPSLTARLALALNDDGSLKSQADAITEVVTARTGYSSLKEAMSALSAGNVLWENVRLVAKSGGQYATIAAAVASLTSGPALVIVISGVYAEDVDVAGKEVSFVAWGNVIWEGRLFPSSTAYTNIRLIEGFYFRNLVTANEDGLLELQLTNDNAESTVVRRCTFDYRAAGIPVPCSSPRLSRSDSCTFYATSNLATCLLQVSAATGSVAMNLRDCRFFIQSPGAVPCLLLVTTSAPAMVRMLNCSLYTAGDHCAAGSGTKANLKLLAAHNTWAAVPDPDTLTVTTDTGNSNTVGTLDLLQLIF